MRVRVRYKSRWWRTSGFLFAIKFQVKKRASVVGERVPKGRQPGSHFYGGCHRLPELALCSGFRYGCFAGRRWVAAGWGLLKMAGRFEMAGFA
jgi:hypothetical protein